MNPADAILRQLGPAPVEYDEVYWIKRRIAEARRDMGEARWQQLQVEWNEDAFTDARSHLASLPPERRAQLEAEWNQ